MEEQVDDEEPQPPPVPNKPVLRQQDATLSEIGETQVSRWVDDTLSITQVRDIADDCNQDLWERCLTTRCKQHAVERQAQGLGGSKN